MKAEKVIELLSQFDISFKPEEVEITGSEKTGPDAEAHYLKIAGEFLILYKEDFIDTLENLKKVIEADTGYLVTEFIKARNPVELKDTEGAQYYKIPLEEAPQDWVPYTVPVGYEYAFLTRVTDDL